MKRRFFQKFQCLNLYYWIINLTFRLQNSEKEKPESLEKLYVIQLYVPKFTHTHIHVGTIIRVKNSFKSFFFQIN